MLYTYTHFRLKFLFGILRISPLICELYREIEQNTDRSSNKIFCQSNQISNVTFETSRETVANREADKWGFLLITPIADTCFFVGLIAPNGPQILYLSFSMSSFSGAKVQSRIVRMVLREGRERGSWIRHLISSPPRPKPSLDHNSCLNKRLWLRQTTDLGSV